MPLTLNFFFSEIKMQQIIPNSFLESKQIPHYICWPFQTISHCSSIIFSFFPFFFSFGQGYIKANCPMCKSLWIEVEEGHLDGSIG